jgi:hypothetical protein
MQGELRATASARSFFATQFNPPLLFSVPIDALLQKSPDDIQLLITGNGVLLGKFMPFNFQPRRL